MKITREGLELNPTPQGLRKNGPLYYLSVTKYGLELVDQAVVTMIKAYIQEESAVPLDGIVSSYLTIHVLPMLQEKPGFLFPTVKNLDLDRSIWSEINGEKLAELINVAISFAKAEVERWEIAPEDLKCRVGRCIMDAKEYLQKDVLTALDGEKYVESMPEGMAEFVTDCWLVSHGCDQK